MLTGDKEIVCNRCDFVFHCGCYHDDHEYKMETCGYYSLWVNYGKLIDRLCEYIEKYEGGS